MFEILKWFIIGEYIAMVASIIMTVGLYVFGTDSNWKDALKYGFGVPHLIYGIMGGVAFIVISIAWLLTYL
jgi:uncharacterized membrane protein